MKIEYIEFVPGQQGTNRAALAKGVTTAECIYAGPWQSYMDLSEKVRKLILNTAPENHYLVTVEHYDTDAVNVFVRKDINEPAVGFVRYRPDE